MNPFDLDVLIWPVMAIFFITLIISFWFTKWPAFSIFVAVLKAGIFLGYFSLVFDGTYTFLDDLSYLEGGNVLLLEGVGITNLAENWGFLRIIGRGDHFVYYLYNAYAFRLFGAGYFSPVALNVLLTVAIAYYGAKLAVVEFGMGKQMSKVFFLFLLLHPDILAWSNVMNGKDILVLLLHVLLLKAVSIYLHGQIQKAFVVAIPIVFVLLFLRFYVPVLFLVALIFGNLLMKQRGGIKYFLFSCGFTVLAFLWIGEHGVQYAISTIEENLVNPIYGFIRILLTPIPFHTEENYAFLNFSALIHWTFIPFFVFGLWRVWFMRTPFSIFFIAYFLVFMSLYAVFGELQGPRHRVQLDYAWAIFQFIGIIVVFNVKESKVRDPLKLAAT